MATARPVVGVLGADGAAVGQTALPAVFSAPIRPDIVRTVHTNLAKNHRQAYAVAMKAGHTTAAESWGTGRAVSRIPRVPGGGTHRAGQGAFGNMCRGGHMYSPNKTWRRWHRKVNVNQKRYAVASALAASALPALVMARGHKIDAVPEVPLVVDDAAFAAGSLSKTSKAVALLKAIGAYQDAGKARDSKAVRTGKGKMRNRRYVSRRGPLVILGSGGDGASAQRALRNLPGVDTAFVSRLSLLQLAPGGHLGRFCVWTKSAFEELDAVFGAGPGKPASAAHKGGYTLPRAPMTNADVARLVNSDEVQSVVRAPRVAEVARRQLKKNPLRNLGALLKLNPYAKVQRREAILSSARNAATRAARLDKVAKGESTGVAAAKRDAGARLLAKKTVASYRVDSDYVGEDYEQFDRWLEIPPPREKMGQE
jgi:large subunit ribosomal protein L4e